MPMVMMEAMCAGCAVPNTGSGGAIELAEQGRCTAVSQGSSVCAQPSAVRTRERPTQSRRDCAPRPADRARRIHTRTDAGGRQTCCAVCQRVGRRRKLQRRRFPIVRDADSAHHTRLLSGDGRRRAFIKEISEASPRAVIRSRSLRWTAAGCLGDDGAAASRGHQSRCVHRLTKTYKLHQRLFGLRGVYRLLGTVLDRDRMTCCPSAPSACARSSLRCGQRSTSWPWRTGTTAPWPIRPPRLVACASSHVDYPLFHTIDLASSSFICQLLVCCDAVGCMTD